MSVNFDLRKIKFSTDPATFQRAIELYQKGKVREVNVSFGEISATVLGTHPYDVFISEKNFKKGDCNCYIGDQGQLCKHMVALAVHAVKEGRPLTESDVQNEQGLKLNDKTNELNAAELTAVKREITEAMKLIKPYIGSSRVWFANQDSLQDGCNMLADIILNLPVNRTTADLLVKLLLRLDRKLMNGVDDSNGIVGGFMTDLVNLLEQFSRQDTACVDAFKQLCGKETCFEWQIPLMRYIE